MKNLNEGSWGYGSLDSDDVLDRIGLYMDAMINILKTQIGTMNLCKASESWYTIGLIDNVMSMLIGSNLLYKVSDDIKDILEEYYQEALKCCMEDTEWQEEYSEPEKMRKSLKATQKRLETYIKMCDNDSPQRLSSQDIPKQVSESVNTELKMEYIPLKYYDTLGYYYIDENVIGFDCNDSEFPTMEMISKSLKAIKAKYGLDIDTSTLQLINSSDIDNFTDVIDYTDLITTNADRYYNSDTFKTQKALHNADYETKRNDDDMKGYLNDRNNNIGRKLTMQNGKEMPLAQWKSFHSTSESKI